MTLGSGSIGSNRSIGGSGRSITAFERRGDLLPMGVCRFEHFGVSLSDLIVLFLHRCMYSLLDDGSLRSLSVLKLLLEIGNKIS